MSISLGTLTHNITRFSNEMASRFDQRLSIDEGTAHNLLTSLNGLCNSLVEVRMAARATKERPAGMNEKSTAKPPSGHVPSLKRHKAVLAMPAAEPVHTNLLPCSCPLSLLPAMDLVYSLDDEGIIQMVMSLFRGSLSRLIAPSASDRSLRRQDIASQHKAA